MHGQFITFVDVSLTETVERTWKERWFSLPWKPRQRFEQVPDMNLYQMSNGSIVGHPVAIHELHRLLADKHTMTNFIRELAGN